jgi:hypothetical protein
LVRRKIEIEKNAIRPLHYGIWDRAQEKLIESEQAIQIMTQAKERRDYEKGWSQFVDSIQEFWIRFKHEGGKVWGESFTSWLSEIMAERNRDPLLNYLYHARNNSQHEIVTLVWSDSHLIIGKGFNGHIKSLNFYPDGSYESDSAPRHPSLPEATVSFSFGDPTLPIVRDNRDENKPPTLPPTSHLGNALHDLAPIAVAKLAITYYQDKFDKAKRTFV